MAQGATIDDAAIILPDGYRPDVPRIPAITAPIDDADTEMASLVGRTVADVEKDLIIKTLDHCLGNRTHAANILGISIRTLRNKLRQYGDPNYAG